MKILALETASDACSAALYWDGQISERFEIIPRLHAERILNMFAELLSDAGGSLQQLDGLSFGQGPGAFTGVRVATAVVQGVAFAMELPVVGVSSLQAMAQGVYRQYGYASVACAFDARMNEVYWGGYGETGGLMLPLQEDRVCHPDQVSLPDSLSEFVGAGGGWKVYGEALSQALLHRPLVRCPDALPHARDILTLSRHAHHQGEGCKADEVAPVYLRDQVVQSRS